jgi:hypothetical protein
MNEIDSEIATEIVNGWLTKRTWKTGRGFDLAQSDPRPTAPCFEGDSDNNREHPMPAESALIVSLIVLAFTAFGASLLWADYSSRNHR